MAKSKFSHISRSDRTRTLIQLGGLISKSGLLEQFDIQLGADLQKQESEIEKAAALLGFLDQQKEYFRNSEKPTYIKNGKMLLSAKEDEMNCSDVNSNQTDSIESVA